jgi:hypothetical protein
MLPKDFTPDIIEDATDPKPLDLPPVPPTEIPVPDEPKPPVSPFPAHPEPSPSPPPSGDPPAAPPAPQA